MLKGLGVALMLMALGISIGVLLVKVLHNSGMQERYPAPPRKPHMLYGPGGAYACSCSIGHDHSMIGRHYGGHHG